MQVLAGQIIDERYEILNELGSGGFATVYKARQVNLDRLVAVKLLDYSLGPNDPALLRFEREAQILSELRHKNLPTFYGFGEWKGRPYLVSELVDGKSLQQALLDSPGLDLRKTSQIMAQVCAALSCAHGNGIIHRDLSAANVLLIDEEDGAEPIVKLIDFGLAAGLSTARNHQKLTEAGTAIGTVMYMSPEQCLGGQVDARSDVYATACLLHECLTGSPPFAGSAVQDTMRQHLHEPFPRLIAHRQKSEPQLTSLQYVVDRASMKNPCDRYDTVDEMAKELAAAIKGKASSEMPSFANKVMPVQGKPVSSTKVKAGLIVACTFVACFIAIKLAEAPISSDEAPESKPTTIAAVEASRLRHKAYQLQLNGQPEKAVELLTKGLHNSSVPGNEMNYISTLRANCYVQMNKPDMALQERLDFLQKTSPSEQRYLGIANHVASIYLSNGRPQDAVELLLRCQKRAKEAGNRTDADASSVQLARTFATMGKLKQSRKLLDDTYNRTDSNHSHALILAELTNIQTCHGERSDATKSFEKLEKEDLLCYLSSLEHIAMESIASVNYNVLGKMSKGREHFHSAELIFKNATLEPAEVVAACAMLAEAALTSREYELGEGYARKGLAIPFQAPSTYAQLNSLGIESALSIHPRHTRTIGEAKQFVSSPLIAYIPETQQIHLVIRIGQALAQPPLSDRTQAQVFLDRAEQKLRRVVAEPVPPTGLAQAKSELSELKRMLKSTHSSAN
jgi:serine/threonine protein kinase